LILLLILVNVPVQVIAWRTVTEMTCKCNVSSGTLNLTHSLIPSHTQSFQLCLSVPPHCFPQPAPIPDTFLHDLHIPYWLVHETQVYHFITAHTNTHSK